MTLKKKCNLNSYWIKSSIPALTFSVFLKIRLKIVLQIQRIFEPQLRKKKSTAISELSKNMVFLSKSDQCIFNYENLLTRNRYVLCFEVLQLDQVRFLGAIFLTTVNDIHKHFSCKKYLRFIFSQKPVSFKYNIDCSDIVIRTEMNL